MIIEIGITEIIFVLLNCWRYLSVVLSVQTILGFFLENLFNLQTTHIWIFCATMFMQLQHLFKKIFCDYVLFYGYKDV